MAIQIIPNLQAQKGAIEHQNRMQLMGQALQGYGEQQQQKYAKQKASEAYRKMGIPEEVQYLPEEAQKEYFKKQFAAGPKPLNALQEIQMKLAEARLAKTQEETDVLSGLLGKKQKKPSVFGIEGKETQEPGQFDIQTGQYKPKETTEEIAGLDINNPRSWPNDIITKYAGFSGQEGIIGVIGTMAEQEKQRRKTETEKKEKRAETKRKEKEKKKELKRQEELKRDEEKRKETLPVKQDIAAKADSARASIENKEHLLELIESGKIDDPTYAALAEALPLNLGKRLLSKETAEYKAGIIDEFKDLKNIFPGQTRVKEIEIMEAKLADLYLTDEQKKAILRSRINANKVNILYEEAAMEIEEEGKPLSFFEYKKELEKRVKPKKEALFNRILDEQKSVINDAENRRTTKLDPNDPEDKQIAEQIMKEAGGDRTKARALAKKKGYTF